MGVKTESANNRKRAELLPVFARHETFHPRFGWLKKGFDKSSGNASLFSEESAPAILGVGKNMVKAIRYWCLAYKILQEDANHKGSVQPTLFGKQLLGKSGWDPYLEDTASLWLLHWNLLKLPCHATAWYYAFNIFNRHDFTSDDILSGLIDYKDRTYPSNRIIESSLSKDISCILRMYTEQKNTDVLREDSIDSPFVELGLIKHYSDSKHYVMNFGSKPGIAPEIIVAVCLDYVASRDEGSRTISTSHLTYEDGSPGLCFKINESAISEAIETVSRKINDIALSETAGIIQLSFNKNPYHLSELVLNKYF